MKTGTKSSVQMKRSRNHRRVVLAMALALLMSVLTFSTAQVAGAAPDTAGDPSEEAATAAAEPVLADDETTESPAPDESTVDTTTPDTTPDTTPETTPDTTPETVPAEDDPSATTAPATTTPATTDPTAPATTVDDPTEPTETTAEPTTTPAVAAAADEADPATEPAKAAEPELAPKAAGPPVYEIEGAWVNQPATIARGKPVVAEWRVNVNDSGEPPSNDPVDNVVVEFNLDKAIFDDIPDLCLVEGVDPPSSISDDGFSLTCNLGTVNMGTAVVVQTPVVATGVTGEEVTHDGTIEGQTVELPPILIRNAFVEDIYWVGTTSYRAWDDLSNPSYVDVDLLWSLRLGKGSDPGPDEVTYRLRVAAQDGSPVNVGVHPNIGRPENHGVPGCLSHDVAQADGHPYSSVPGANPLQGNFVDECILAPVAGQPGFFDLTLRGIDYSLLNTPTQDSFGNLLPPNWDVVATGQVWFRVTTDQPGSITLTIPNPPTYEAPTGQTYPDPPGNNSSNKVYTLSGSFSAAYLRSLTGNGGQRWDDTYRVAAGTTVIQYVAVHFGADQGVDPDALYGNCLVFQPQFVDFDPTAPMEVYAARVDEATTIIAPPSPFEYYTGSVGNPDTFNCGTGTWTTTQPTDPTTVTAVRMRYPFSTYSANDAIGIQIRVGTKIHDDPPVAVGQDIWTFGSYLRNGTWLNPGDVVFNDLTPTPDYQYPHTNGRRDVVVVVLATPFLEKAAAQATVTPGVPADFTLTYSATGTGSIPDTVDGYQIVDTLPVGMTYEPGSADPEPVVTTSGGQQVLTWTLDDVATNVEHELTYQAVADSSVEAGTQLTNTAVSSLANASSQPVTETVTTTTNGFTIILKTADVDYIPNVAGDGVGTGSWTVLIDSSDPLPQAFTDTIDILPYSGDGRGTSFSGSYTLDEVVLPDGGTVYYTDADPATLNDDPAHESNGAAGDPTGNDVGWTTTRPDTVTAIRVIGEELEAGGEFSFQVVITTDGAQPQDVYVNRAQARAEHTELVMRTSAALVVTDYTVVKVSDPPSGSTVSPESVVTYTVTVTQVGPVPAGALWTDTLTEVFDDAVYNDDVTADMGTATIDGDVLSWEGVLPVGGVATITYSVTVKDRETLAAEGDTVTTNVVSSPGCRMPEDCTTTVVEGWYDYSKTSDPVPGSDVVVGEEITYSVGITQHGEGAIAGAIAIDDLSAVLDDATWNNEIDASIGTASLDGTTLTWTGDLEVGDVATLTYSVTVTEGGDSELENVVTSPDEERSECVPAPDENPDCRTDHQLIGSFIFAKTSNPAPGTTVRRGDVVTYTVLIEHVGPARVEDASVRDDLAAVLADAAWNGDARATSGGVAFAGTSLTWTGDLEVDQVVTLTYSVTVAETDARLRNVVTSDDPRGACAGPGDASSTAGRAAVRQIPATGCVTEHLPPTASPSPITPTPVAVTG